MPSDKVFFIERKKLETSPHHPAEDRLNKTSADTVSYRALADHNKENGWFLPTAFLQSKTTSVRSVLWR
ncbi:MAG: hypothetical protein ACK5RG_19675 [Cyclobacteriaceae bacterium]|jgi:hypothetical protein|nr:hypothetical protein [Flammeovirgaceae bacterium]